LYVATNVAVCPASSFDSISLSEAPPAAEVLVVVLFPPAAVVVVAPEPAVVVVVLGDDEELQAVAPRAMAARASDAASRLESLVVVFGVIFMGRTSYASARTAARTCSEPTVQCPTFPDRVR
jgi:hypothetical protein